MSSYQNRMPRLKQHDHLLHSSATKATDDFFFFNKPALPVPAPPVPAPLAPAIGVPGEEAVVDEVEDVPATDAGTA